MKALLTAIFALTATTWVLPHDANLRRQLQYIADSADGQVGIALIAPDGDTLTLNNTDSYQLMSVFKLHQALAVAHALDISGQSLDTILNIDRSQLSATTWSPMYRQHLEEQIKISVTDLLGYSLQLSDNNASNILFESIISPPRCDMFIRTSTGLTDFAIQYTEHSMQANPTLADGNHTSPLACARLIQMVFTDSLVSSAKQQAIQSILLDCKTGNDRIGAPLKDKADIRMAHKTGSGFRTPCGRLSAQNDVAYISLPDGRTYSLAVLIRNFYGTADEASAVIANISQLVFDSLVIAAPQ